VPPERQLRAMAVVAEAIDSKGMIGGQVADLEATSGSLLAAGVLHASFNASGTLGFAGGWQFLPALLLLALGLAVARGLRGRRGVAA